MNKVNKFSQAIRLGASITKECHGTWFDGDNSDCAVYAAVVAIGAKTPPIAYRIYATLKERFPGLTQDFIQAAWYLHDTGISREAVADWVESQGF